MAKVNLNPGYPPEFDSDDLDSLQTDLEALGCVVYTSLAKAAPGTETLGSHIIIELIDAGIDLAKMGIAAAVGFWLGKMFRKHPKAPKSAQIVAPNGTVLKTIVVHDAESDPEIKDGG